jgi:hypothetical protein
VDELLIGYVADVLTVVDVMEHGEGREAGHVRPGGAVLIKRGRSSINFSKKLKVC